MPNIAGSVEGRSWGCTAWNKSLAKTQTPPFKQFSTVAVALDPDAILKSLEMVKELRNYVSNVKAIKLTDDLKYRNEDDLNKLKEVMNGTNTN